MWWAYSGFPDRVDVKTDSVKKIVMTEVFYYLVYYLFNRIRLFCQNLAKTSLHVPICAGALK